MYRQQLCSNKRQLSYRDIQDGQQRYFIDLFKHGLISRQDGAWNCTLQLDIIIPPPGSLTVSPSTVPIDVTSGEATFPSVSFNSSGLYAIKVVVMSSSYTIIKTNLLRVTIAGPAIVETVKKSVKLTIDANFSLIEGKHEFFQAVLENHFYKIYPTSEVVFSNFVFTEGS